MSKPTVAMDRWGKDHWSVFAYIETTCVDGRNGLGIPDRRRIYADPDRHPGHGHLYAPTLGAKKYPIRLRGGDLKHAYDEWDCLDDIEAVGLLENVGTGINPIYRMTALGSQYAGQLRTHKANGGQFSNFQPEVIDAA